jgi:hypothetical protein
MMMDFVEYAKAKLVKKQLAPVPNGNRLVTIKYRGYRKPVDNTEFHLMLANSMHCV